MLQSRPFIQHVLRNPRFNRRVVSLLADEAHCISHWGSGFRKKYGTLGIARAFLPRGTPVVAMSATLTPRARRDIVSKLGFIKGSSRFINVGNDRPNVSIIVRACENALNTFSDLDFVIPSNITSLSAIPKTWIYVDNISDCEDIVDHLCELLKHRLTLELDSKEIDHAIRSYHAVHTLEYRQKAMESFRAGDMRIMVCTEAAGMVSLIRSKHTNTYNSFRDVISPILQWSSSGSCQRHFPIGSSAQGVPHEGAVARVSLYYWLSDLCTRQT